MSLIREVPGQRRVERVEIDGECCVRRTLLTARLSPGMGRLVEKIVLHGHGSMLGIIPDDLQLTLEGYRVAARLPRDVSPAPWTHAVAAGVDVDGHVTVSTQWIEGTPLHHAPPAPPDVARERALDALRILVLLHSRLVTYGDFKSENLVLRPDGTIALIDLDTLREVAEPVGWAPTRDLTRAWAAPEQTNAQRTYLASDLWAWAQVVTFLFPSGAPPEWEEALAACRNHDPLARPRTDSLLSWLELGAPLVDWLDRPAVAHAPATEAPTQTERVPEVLRPLSTERVADSTPIVRAPTPVTVEVAPRRRFGCLHVGAVLSAIFLLCCVGLPVAYDRERIAEANEIAEQTLVNLKGYKTRPALNKDRTQRERLRQIAQGAWDIRETPRTGAVRALATVWAEGWQDSGHEWNEASYAEGLAVVEAAPHRRDAEVLLARATLDGAACRLDRLDPEVSARCARSLSDITAAQRAIPDGAEANWLRVEAAWTEVLVRAEVAEQARLTGNPEGATHLDAGLARCTEAEAWLDWAPVNGPELLQDCLHLAGAGEDVAAYVRWGRRLVAADLVDGPLTLTTLGHLYAAGRDCSDVRVDKRRGEWRINGPSWCVALGHAARGCHDLSRSIALDGQMSEPNRQWAALAEATALPATCAR